MLNPPPSLFVSLSVSQIKNFFNNTVNWRCVRFLARQDSWHTVTALWLRSEIMKDTVSTQSRSPEAHLVSGTVHSCVPCAHMMAVQWRAHTAQHGHGRNTLRCEARRGLSSSIGTCVHGPPRTETPLCVQGCYAKTTSLAFLG